MFYLPTPSAFPVFIPDQPATLPVWHLYDHLMLWWRCAVNTRSKSVHRRAGPRVVSSRPTLVEQATSQYHPDSGQDQRCLMIFLVLGTGGCSPEARILSQYKHSSDKGWEKIIKKTIITKNCHSQPHLPELSLREVKNGISWEMFGRNGKIQLYFIHYFWLKWYCGIYYR